MFGEKLQAPLLGTSQLTTGEITADNCVVAMPGSTMRVLPAGRVRSNPLELLESHPFTEVMAKLANTYEIIVFDNPPIQLARVRSRKSLFIGPPPLANTCQRLRHVTFRPRFRDHGSFKRAERSQAIQ